MLIKEVDEGVFSLDEGKSPEQVKFFSTEARGDFHQSPVTVVGFGSRPIKRARLLSNTDVPVIEAHVDSFDRRGLAQGDFLEESNRNVGRLSQAHQGDGRISETNSIVTNGLRSRTAWMKMAGPICANEYVKNGVNIKTVSESKSGALEGMVNHVNVNGNAGCTIHSMQEDAKDTTSTSGDEGLFVIQVRSPTSKHLLHGRKQSNDQERDVSPSCRSNTQCTEKLGPNKHHNNGLTDDSIQLSSSLSRNASKEAGTPDMEGPEGNPSVRREDSGLISIKKDIQVTPNLPDEVESARAVELVPEQVEHSTPQVIPEASVVGVSDAGREEETGVNSSDILNVYVRKRKWSSPAQVATVDSVRSQECGSSRSEDHVDERVIKHYVRRPHRQTGSHSQPDMIEKPSEHVMTSFSNGVEEAVHSLQAEHRTDSSVKVESEGNFNVFQRRSKMNHLSHTEHRADVSTPAADIARVESEGTLNVFQRRSKKHHLPEAEHHADTSVRVESEGNFNVFQRRSKINQAEHHAHVLMSKADVAGVESERTLNVFQRRSKQNQLPKAEHQANIPARVETEGNLNVFQRRCKKNVPQKEPSRNDIIGLQNAVNEKHTPPGYVRADHQPNWLPEGWTLEIREGKSTAHPRDKYYHDHKSGRIFRSKNEVVQFLVDGRIVGAQMLSDTNGMKVQLQNKKRLPIPISPAKQTGFQSHLIMPSLSRQTGVISGKDAGATALHGGAANGSQLLSSGDGVQLSTGSPVDVVKSPSDQGDTENRGKLIFRLKRKQPDSEGGKGRSKRPMYEVVHGEKASSSTSPLTNQEKLTVLERTGQDAPSIPGSVQMHLQGISSVKETLSPNVVSGSMPVKAQVAKHIPLEKPSFNSPSPLIMPIVDRTLDQSATSFERSRGAPGSIPLEHSIMSNWGIKHNPLQHPSQHLELLQQETYTAFGIPSTIRYPGLPQMASYSANHTHVFLDPVDNTIPPSWQYPFISQTSTPVTFGPFSSAFTPSVTTTISSTAPLPVFEHNPGVSYSKNLNATATMFPCSESGADSRTRDSNAKLAEGGPQVQKAPKASKALTKADHTKLFLDLGRRLCLAGVGQKTRNPESVGTLNFFLKPQTLLTNLEG